MTRAFAGKLTEWIYRALVMAALAALAFLRDSATKADLVPLREDIAEVRKVITDLDKRLAVSEALRKSREKTGQ